MQRLDHLIARRAERFGGRIEIKPVPAFILHLGQQDRFAAQVRRARNPIALRQHADDFAVRVLRHLPHQRLAIRLRHPILRLDELIVGDARFERGDQRGIFGDGVRPLVLPLRSVVYMGAPLELALS